LCFYGIAGGENGGDLSFHGADSGTFSLLRLPDFGVLTDRERKTRITPHILEKLFGQSV